MEQWSGQITVLSVRDGGSTGGRGDGVWREVGMRRRPVRRFRDGFAIGWRWRDFYNFKMDNRETFIDRIQICTKNTVYVTQRGVNLVSPFDGTSSQK
jgi:hypothetical protein